MKIAIVGFHPLGDDVTNVGGVSTAPFYMKEMLSNVIDDQKDQIDIISLTRIKKKNFNRVPGVIYLDNDRKTPDVSEKYLNLYDYIIFNTPGYSYEGKVKSSMSHRYDYLLNNLKVPYSFVVNNENDTKIFPHLQEFVDGKFYRGPFFNSTASMNELFASIIPEKDHYVAFNYIPNINSLDDILEQAKYKIKSGSKVVGCTSRWSPIKRIEDLVLDSKLYHDKGLKIYIYGGGSNYFYTKKLMESYDKNSEYVDLMGEYGPSDLDRVMKPIMFHYNFVYLKVNRGAKFQPRLELASVEAFNHGALPVVAEETTPEWVKEGTIRLSGKTQQHEIPEVLDSLSESEYLGKLKTFHKILTDHQLMYSNLIYNYILRMISNEE